MEVKPSKGLKVKVSAVREAIFGEEGVEVRKIPAAKGKQAGGTLTGRTLVGYAEMKMDDHSDHAQDHSGQGRGQNHF